MLASAAARAHHGREEKHSREEALKRSQIALLADGHGEEEEELHTQLLPPHYLLVPFKDCDYELHDGQVSWKWNVSSQSLSSAWSILL